MRDELKKAIDIMREGGVVIYPTDTAVGIGCRIDNHTAVERIFSIKGRDSTKATPVLFSTTDMVEQYVATIDPLLREQLMDVYWPGALTIVLNANEEKVDSLIRGGGKSMGARIPNHEEIRRLISEIGIPIIGTSANFSGEATVFSTSDVSENLKSLVDYVLSGECSSKQSSTVIDGTSRPWKILRQGGVTLPQ